MVNALPAGLAARLEPAARDWLRLALADAEAHHREPNRGTAAWELHFAAAGRHCGPPAALEARTLLLHAAGAGAATVTRLYRQGTAGERHAVLHALDRLPLDPADVVPLLEDALRTHDTRLVAAAAGSGAAARLDAHSWRHAVLKCLFTGVPLTSVASFEQRARGDAELARMLTDYAHERTAAGRSIPADLHRALRTARASRADASPPQPEET